MERGSDRGGGLACALARTYGTIEAARLLWEPGNGDGKSFGGALRKRKQLVSGRLSEVHRLLADLVLRIGFP
jgi:hypothetical protein